eukprot:TRINITY_DN2662_c0_g1_i1.p1 TRINITY_DN2662_c0_g1~~TRINITY_DN2662_c0_g1_i1.p1  ORF type:complete len:366 (+),score=145.38 TRINITY_DN2662_c0_g1_i1:668-1765(+)
MDPIQNIQTNVTTERIFKQLQEINEAKEKAKKEKEEKDKEEREKAEEKEIERLKAKGLKPIEKKKTTTTTTTAAPPVKYASCSLTSSSFSAKQNSTVEEEKPKHTTKKGYVRLCTNLGDLNLELHCDLVPKTTENFLLLCEGGYYTNHIFHRSIKNFMIQGGDPTGTGTGGESAWEKAFNDEFKPQLRHSGRGILSMANSGPNTNGSQFFILFKSATHLDNKHSVFGKVVGGLDVLTAMENIPTDNDDRPLQEIKILKTMVFVNPFDEEEPEETAEEKKKKEEEKKQAAQVGQWFSNPTPVALPKTTKTGIGKYINNPNSKTNILDSQPTPNAAATTTTTSNTTNIPDFVEKRSRQKPTFGGANY